MQKDAITDGLKYVEEHFNQKKAFYRGYKSKNMKHGPGILEMYGVGRYEGEWKYNMMTGYGKFIHITGDIE